MPDLTANVEYLGQFLTKTKNKPLRLPSTDAKSCFNIIMSNYPSLIRITMDWNQTHLNHGILYEYIGTANLKVWTKTRLGELEPFNLTFKESAKYREKKVAQKITYAKIFNEMCSILKKIEKDKTLIFEK